MKQKISWTGTGQQRKRQKPLYKARRHTLRSSKKQALAAYLFLLPSLAGMAVFVLLPFLDAVRRSFFSAMGGKFVGLQNYHEVLHNGAFLDAAKNTARFTAFCIPLLLVVSLILALAIRSKKSHRDFFKTTALIPMAIPVASVVLLWKVFFHENGLLNAVLLHFGYQGYDWMNTGRAFSVLLFSYIWKNAGYDMVLWLAGLSGISQDLYEAAMLDGAGAFARFFYITLPGLLPTIFTIGVLSLLNSFKVFREAYLISGSYPHKSIYLLQHTFNNWFYHLDIQKMCAAAVLCAMVILVLILLFQKIGREDQE